MALFTIKKKDSAPQGFPGQQMPSDVPQPMPQVDLSQPPVSLVLQMRQQGFSNNQIVQGLQREGFKSHLIFDAMNQADNRPGSDVGAVEQSEQPMDQGQGYSEPQPMGASAGSSGPHSKEEIEEIVESVVEEKIEDVNKSMNKLGEWKDKTDERLAKIEQMIVDLKANFEGLHTGVLGKIEEYDKGINDVGTEIKALEKVFQKILPTLTENVSELSRITQTMKNSVVSKK